MVASTTDKYASRRKLRLMIDDVIMYRISAMAIMVSFITHVGHLNSLLLSYKGALSARLRSNLPPLPPSAMREEL